MNPFRPMLAETVDDLKALRYPLLCSPKFDGFRAIVDPRGHLMSRRLKRIPNRAARARFEDERLIACDGELIAGPPTATNVFNRSTTAVMSEDAIDPALRYYIFDWVAGVERPYEERFEVLTRTLKRRGMPEHVELVEQRVCESPEDVLRLEELAVGLGYEGVMLRDPEARYKWGRSTLREQYLLKLKRFEDSEAIVLDSVELMENTNPAMTDERGYAKRSHAQAGMVLKGMLGSLVVRDVKTGVEFNIGIGFTEEQRISMWKDRRRLKNKIAKYRFQSVGVKDRPRFPRFLGWRDRIDM